MNVQEIASEGLSRTFEVTTSAMELEDKLSAKIDEIQPEVRLKGFRPGKVPAGHIRKMFGASIMSDILRDLVPQRTQEVLDEHKLRPAAQPEVDVKSDADDVIKGGQDFVFELKLEVMPEFETEAPKDLELVRPVASVADEQIDEALADLASQSKSYEDKGKAAKAASGDVAVIDFVGKIDGEAFEGGSANDARVAIGEGAFIPGFEDQLIGTKAGDEVEIKVTFPADYQAEALAGKDAVFETVVKAVEAPQDTPVDDTLAERYGLSDLDALKTAMKQRFETEHAQAARLKLKRQLLDKLDETYGAIQLPERMVDAEFQGIWREVQQAKDNDQLEDDDKDKSDEELEADYREIANRRVRLGLVLAELGRKANIDVTQEELAGAVNQEAARYPGREREVVEYFQQNPGALQGLRAPIYEEKVVDYLLELAEVSEVEVDRDFLFDDEAVVPVAGGKKKAAAKKKAPAKKAAAKKADDGEADAKPAKKAPAKKAPAKKPAAKKAPAKKAAAKKPAAKS
ncbi:MAG: trigger factor [Pseudomonadota bacterium]